MSRSAASFCKPDLFAYDWKSQKRFKNESKTNQKIPNPKKMQVSFKIIKAPRKGFKIESIRRANEKKCWYFSKIHQNSEKHAHSVAIKPAEECQKKNFKNFTNFKIFLNPEDLKQYFRNGKFVFLEKSSGKVIDLSDKPSFIKKSKKASIERIPFNFKKTAIADFLLRFEEQMKENNINDKLLKKLQLLSYVKNGTEKEKFKEVLETDKDFSDFAQFFLVFFNEKKNDFYKDSEETIENCGSLEKFLKNQFAWAESEPGSSDFVSKAIRVFEKIPFKNKISLSTILQIKNKQNFIDYIVFEAHDKKLLNPEYIKSFPNPDTNPDAMEINEGNDPFDESDADEDEENFIDDLDLNEVPEYPSV